MACDATQLLSALQARATETRDPGALGAIIVESLQAHLPQASWIGVYWLRGRSLVLGPFVGAPTEHTRIPVGVGVCGQAIEDDRDRIIADVRDETNYLACSATVRSEMVVLIRSRGEVVGQIDLDADEVDAFDDDDLCIVRAVADGLGGVIEVTPFDPDAEADGASR